MKKTARRISSFIISMVVVVSLVTTASAEDLTFDDVQPSDWSYDSIMRATELGLFKGKTEPDENGVGHFDKTGTISRAEFITVAVRILAPNGDYSNGSPWYQPYYETAVSLGIINRWDFDQGRTLTADMTREEMAYVIANTMAFLGEVPETLISNLRIPDFGDTLYQGEVRVAYSMGILCGVDEAGTFLPKGILTREQAAAVFVRMIDKDKRVAVDLSVPGTEAVIDPVSGLITMHEGEVHYRPLKAGDTIIKADGTKVVLTETDVHGILIVGLGQGVDVYSGYTDNGITLNMNDGKKHGAGELYNGGDATTLTKCWNGEVRSGREIDYILTYYKELGFTKPTTQGTYDGEHRNLVWRWTTTSEVEDNFTPQWMFDFN